MQEPCLANVITFTRPRTLGPRTHAPPAWKHAVRTVRFIVFQHRDAVRHSVSASFSMPVWHEAKGGESGGYHIVVRYPDQE